MLGAVSQKKQNDDDTTLTSLPSKKCDYPLQVAEKQDKMKSLHESGGAVNTAVVLGAAGYIVLKHIRCYYLNMEVVCNYIFEG